MHLKIDEGEKINSDGNTGDETEETEEDDDEECQIDIEVEDAGCSIDEDGDIRFFDGESEINSKVFVITIY